MQLDLTIFERIGENTNKIQFLYNSLNRTITYLSPYYSKVWERPFHNIATSYFEIIDSIHSQDRLYVKEMFSQFLREEFTDTLEFRIIMPDESIKHISASLSSISNVNGEIEWIGGFVEDITKAKEYEGVIYQYTANKNSILEILTHDIGGQLSMIENIVSVMKEKENTGDSTELNRYTQLIQEISKQSMDMIIEFTHNEYLDSSRTGIRKTRIDLVARVKGVIDTYKAGRSMIRKQFFLNTSAEVILLDVDDVKLLQVINNLISNAIKFTYDEGTIHIGIEEKENSVLIWVKDDGIGIPENFKPLLFEKFTPARRVGLRGEKSIGLGMSIVKKVVELQKGKVWFESEENKGSTFYIEIPKI